MDKSVDGNTALEIAKFVALREACEEYKRKCIAEEATCIYNCAKRFEWCVEERGLAAEEVCRASMNRCIENCKELFKTCVDEIPYCNEKRNSKNR